MPRYKTTVNTFLAPEYVEAGSIIEWDGVPSFTFIPICDEAKARFTETFKDRPNVFAHPTEALRIVGGEPGETQASVVVEGPKDEDNLGTLAQPGKATPGVTEGGKPLEIKK